MNLGRLGVNAIVYCGVIQPGVCGPLGVLQGVRQNNNFNINVFMNFSSNNRINNIPNVEKRRKSYFYTEQK